MANELGEASSSLPCTRYYVSLKRDIFTKCEIKYSRQVVASGACPYLSYSYIGYDTPTHVVSVYTRAPVIEGERKREREREEERAFTITPTAVNLNGRE